LNGSKNGFTTKGTKITKGEKKKRESFL